MKKSVKETVRELIEPTVTELGYRIWDITFSKIGADYHLEITIDSDAGIGIEDCERVHRAIDPLLDECDPIESFYYLEVSSPGIERELRTDFHINSSLGALVELKLFAPHTDGRKTVTGILESYADGVITVSEEGGSLSLGREAVSKITTVYTED
ncbi:MAG: ribosome maturation factor RimP [Clostridia bacterium]|nr:ribosome maturation factor RimP [Clostridia bacterium]